MSSVKNIQFSVVKLVSRSSGINLLPYIYLDSSGWSEALGKSFYQGRPYLTKLSDADKDIMNRCRGTTDTLYIYILLFLDCHGR